MTALRTDKALADRRRCLKPLLAQVLAGEPWKAAFTDPASIPSNVAAACIVSYISRRIDAWEALPVEVLPNTLAELISRDRHEHQLGGWPFLDALESMLPFTHWKEMDHLLAFYRYISMTKRKK